MKPWTYQSWVSNCTIPSVPLFAIIASPARYIEGHHYSVSLFQQLHVIIQVSLQWTEDPNTLIYLTVTPDPTSYHPASIDSVELITLSVEHTSTIPILVGKPSQGSWDPFYYFYFCSHVLLMAQYEVSLAGRVSFINMQVTIIMWLACDQDCLRLRHWPSTDTCRSDYVKSHSINSNILSYVSQWTKLAPHNDIIRMS